MNKTRILQGVRIMRFEDLYERRTKGKLTVEEAAEMLGVHERTFRRWSRKYECDWKEGLNDERLYKIAHNAAPVDEVIKL